MKEESLFAAALDKPTEADRWAFLDEACAGDVELRRRVEQLLASHARSPGILDGDQNAANLLGAYRPEPPLAAEQLFAGRFQLRQKLGEGGMGEVWVADQHEPVRRRVALKVIRLGGLASELLAARFEQERQALALMDHANIAKVFDAGVAGGRPFFVMELIQGLSITEYCNQAGLSPRERVELFLPVCQAVQHAHQKGIIHRDLKPSNILVGLYDGKPVPKVIDFGVAKATGPHLSEPNVSTHVGTLIGTLEYMSPEQADPSSRDVDTRSDVYALGVVLYELLTGTVPFSSEQLYSAPFAEMLRIIREEEPPKPSTRIWKDEGGRTKDEKSKNRSYSSFILHPSSFRELDWIVMKCLEKDRNRRYETASALALDLERYLANEPVLAGPPSTGYRLRKHLQRNRGVVLAASLVLLALLGGIVGTTVGMVRSVWARHAEAERAEGERLAKEMAQKRLSQIEKAINLLSSIFEELDPRAEEKEGRPLRAILGDRLVRAAADLEGEAIGDPLMVAGLQNRLGLSLLRLGMARQAIPLFLKSRATREAHLGADHADTLASMNNLARGYQEDGKPGLAWPLLKETLQRRRATLGDDHRDTLTSMNNLASGYGAIGKPRLALPLLQETLARRKAILGPYHQETLTSMNNLAVGYWAAGEPEKTVPLHEETLRLRKAHLGPHHIDTLQSMSNLGSSYRYARKLSEAQSLHEEAVRLCKARLGPDDPYTLFSMSNLAFTYEALGQSAKAVALREETLQRRKARLGEGHPDTFQSVYELARGYSMVGKPEQALPLFQQAAAGVEKLEFAHRHVRRIIPALCECLEQHKQYDQAETWRRKMLAVLKEKDGPHSAAYAWCLMGLGGNLLRQKRHADAEPVLRECLTIFQKERPQALHTFRIQSMLGASLLGQKKYADAEMQLIQSYQGMKKTSGTVPAHKGRDPSTRKPLIEALQRLVQLYDAWGKPEAAGKWRKELEEAKAA
jgi:serine/threonine protein kinase/tetratricopeptide (TPR) repeat protein